MTATRDDPAVLAAEAAQAAASDFAAAARAARLEHRHDRAIIALLAGARRRERAGAPALDETMARELGLALAANRVDMVLSAGRGPVLDVAWSPDGAILATAGADGRVVLWDAASGEQATALTGHGGKVRSVAFAPDAPVILTASEDGTARLWDAVSGGEIRRFEGYQSTVFVARLSPDGARLIVASDPDHADLLETATGDRIARLSGHRGVVMTSAAFSADGARAATTCDEGSAMLWDARSGEHVATLHHAGAVRYADFSPDGTLLATAGYDERARTWNAQDGAPVSTFASPRGRVFFVSIDPDGKLLALVGDGGMAGTAPLEGGPVTLLPHHDAQILGPVAFARGARGLLTVTGGADQRAIVTDLETRTATVLAGHEGRVWAARPDPFGLRVATASADGAARVWSLSPPSAAHGDPLAAARLWAAQAGRNVTQAEYDAGPFEADEDQEPWRP